jgi:hypothetical protein
VTSPVRGAAGNRTFIATLGSGLQAIPRIGFTRVRELRRRDHPTTNGAVNIVTRAGSNDFRGSGFAFYRDHHLAAYPGLSRDRRNPESPILTDLAGSFRHRLTAIS